ncbi:hypothetical protein [Chelatococcus asaccharovorans]|uniref:Uncharacterized protein n=1 Tax=Chelatococcus asaccharovorans TaxID=28210 RepID=A0A2V3U2F3_9HYPH|nr:hypothetical protein [Chelatococcus asaccharovorans]MBS7702337.1 hypothetical protein [Chelatococcus asaccharovorans]PXW56461.1 hypothetical protein C7450_108211 [Chelatococcus asaccharovorans]
MTKTMVCALAMGASMIGTAGFTAVAAPLMPGSALSGRPEIVSIQFRARGDTRRPMAPRFHPLPPPRPRVIHRTAQPRDAVVVRRATPICRCR